jgi:protein required for attachment to host cells
MLTSRRTTRVIVAHDSGARTFENRGPGKGLVQVSEVDFEDGRRHAGELDADQGGRSATRAGHGHAYESHEDSRQHAVGYFAKQLAQDLARELHLGAFDQLVLVAPPRFLGMLRDALDSKLQRALIGTVCKDLPRATGEELCKHVASLIAV